MRRLLARLEHARTLDRVGDPAQSALLRMIPPGVRDLLHGVWFGHALHPVLVQAPIGAWMSAAVLDAIPGRERSATTLLAVGTAAALPAAVAGATDWSTLGRDQRRVGLVHAAANTAALTLFGASLIARVRGRHRTGRALSYAGLGVAGASAYLGGHLSYAQGAAVNHAATALPRVPEGWHPVGEVGEFSLGVPSERTVGQEPVLVYRHGDAFTVMLARCAHRGGPLADGKVFDLGGEVCVRCPWHGSVFALRDGAVVHGPAASDQPLLRWRVEGGRLEVAGP